MGMEPMRKMAPNGLRPGNNPSGKGMAPGNQSIVRNQQSPKGGLSADHYNSVIGSKPSVNVMGVNLKGSK